MDTVSPATRSRMMSNIGSKDTKPEINLRRILHAQSFRYRLRTKILNITPDIVLPKYKLAIFVHGCFWHRHHNCKYSTFPKTNIVNWKIKFQKNLNRDARVISKLLEAEWRVMVIWECWEKRSLDISWIFPWIRVLGSKFIAWPLVHDDPHLDEKNSPHLWSSF